MDIGCDGMQDYLISLKNKYGYSDEMLQILGNVINAFINVLGDKHIQLVLDAVDNTFVFKYNDALSATDTLNQIINDGTNHNISAIAEGGGFMEDYYTYSNNQIHQNFAVGISINSQNALSTLVHELCHVISTYGKLKIEDNKAIVGSGFNITSYQLVDGKLSDEIANNGEIFNEMVTENLAMQIMDYLEPNISHEPTAYNGYVNDFKGIFRSAAFNKVLIDDYVNSSSNFLLSLESVILKEQIVDEIDSLYSYVDLNDIKIKEYLDYLKSLSVKDFFSLYIEYCNFFTKGPDGIDKSTFRQMKRINSAIVRNMSQKIMENNYSK